MLVLNTIFTLGYLLSPSLLLLLTMNQKINEGTFSSCLIKKECTGLIPTQFASRLDFQDLGFSSISVENYCCFAAEL